MRGEARRGEASVRGGAQRLCVAWCMQCIGSAWSAALLRSAQHDAARHIMARGSRARIVVRALLPVSIAVARVGWGSSDPSGSVPSRASGQCRAMLSASAGGILGPSGSVASGAPGWCRAVLSASAGGSWARPALCRAVRLAGVGSCCRVGWEDPGAHPALCRAVRLASVVPCCPRRLGGSWGPSGSLATSAPDAPDWRSGQGVGTSESGAQPPVGRTKIFSEGPKWTWTFANFFLHWTFSVRVAPSVGLRPSSLQLQIHRSGIHWFQGFTGFRYSPVGFSSRIHQCARRAGLEADPRVGTSESGAQPPIGRTKIFSEGPKWTWTFMNFFLHWTFLARVAP
jgi:hypothetical protein